MEKIKSQKCQTVVCANIMFVQSSYFLLSNNTKNIEE